MSKWPWPESPSRITRSSPACFAASASSITPRIACAGSGAGDDPLGAREPERRRERLVLLVGARLHEAVLHEAGHHRRVAVVAQPARVHRRRHEVVPERVHRHQRREPDRVAEVVAVGAARERGAGGRLRGEEARPRLAAQHAPHEREREPGEVRAAAHAAHHHVRLVARHLDLGQRLLADHGLVQADVVQDRAERVVRAGVAGGDLDRLRDRDAERAGRMRGLAAPRLGGVAGRADHARAPALHHRAAVGLLVVARADHVDHALEPEQAAGERQRRAPLARARLGGEPLDAGLLVGVGLRHGAVRLVRAGGRDALVLVVDARRGIELSLEVARAVERGRAPQLVDLAHRLRDLDLGLGRDLLADHLHREDRREVVRAGRLHRARVERRQRVAREVREEVHPVGGDAVLGERELDLVGHAAILMAP